RTLGDRSQILSWSAVPHRAQRVASIAPAATPAVHPVASGLLGIIALLRTLKSRAPLQRQQRSRTSGAERRGAAAARSAGMTRLSFPRSAWHSDKTCLRNFPAR